MDRRARSAGTEHPATWWRRSWQQPTWQYFQRSGLRELCPPTGRGTRVHSCRPVWAHTWQAFPRITSLLRNQLQGAKEVLFPFFKDDKCIDINIFLVPMATIFKRGWSWLISLPMWFYLSWTFHTSSGPWLWGGCSDPPRPSYLLRYLT